MINGILIKDIAKKYIRAFCCYSLVITSCTGNVKKMHQYFAPYSFKHFKNRLLFALFS